MKRKIGLTLLVLVVLFACQVVPTPPALQSTLRPSATPRPPAVTALPSALPSPTPAALETGVLPDATPPAADPPGALASIPYRGGGPFAEVAPVVWSPQPGELSWTLSLPADLRQAANLPAVGGLTLRQQDLLARNGFVVVHSQEKSFSDVRQRVSLFYGQPYLLTTDAAQHALKITYDALMRALAGEELQPRLLSLVQATYQQVISYFPLVSGSEMEAEMHLAAAYLATALRLLDPQVAIAAEIEPQVVAQVDQILAVAGRGESPLLPGFVDDFSLYRPRGYFQGDPQLENYFRALTWLERAYFPLEEGAAPQPSYRLPQIVTLALRQASTLNGPAADEWGRLADLLDFSRGRRLGGSPAELAVLMDQAYGPRLTILSLLDSPNQDVFRSLLRDRPFPQLGFPLVIDPAGEVPEKSWSFFGRHQELDVLALNRLAADQPPDPLTGPYSPTGLEMMALLGSQPALEILAARGSGMGIDAAKIVSLQERIDRQPGEAWSASAHSLRLESLRQGLGFGAGDERAQSLPFASTPAWGTRVLSGALGAWAELQIDASHFVPPPAGEAVETEAKSPPAPAFVEPNPAVFYKLSQLAYICVEGINERGMSGESGSRPGPDSLSGLLLAMLDLADRLQRLGDIAARELRGERLGTADYALIQSPLGPAEGGLASARPGSAAAETETVYTPSLGTFDYGGDRLTHVATGRVDRIYMLVPLEGGMAVAQGGIYSYYEFSVLRSRGLDEQSWGWRLANDPPPAPVWLQSLYLEEGTPLDVLAYRIGDLYRVHPAAQTLSLRSAPGRDSRTTALATPGEVFTILDGPVEANGLRWWEVEFLADPSARRGWIYENQDWYERAWDF